MAELKSAKFDLLFRSNRLGKILNVSQAVFFILAILFFLLSAIVFGVFAALISLGLHIASERAEENFQTQQTLSQKPLLARIDELYRVLEPIYAQFIELPPDWSQRRHTVRLRDNHTCKECGKREGRRRREFHVHHKIPKAQPKGHHGLDNLVLLCKRCHERIHPWMSDHPAK